MLRDYATIWKHEPTPRKDPLNSFYAASLTQALAAHLVSASHVTALVLSDNAMSDSMLDDSNLVTALRAHGGLELLDLSGNRLRSLSGIERPVTEGRNDKAAPIKTLILNDNRLSSEGPICFIQTLKFNLNLKSLSFRNCNLSESATSLLGPMLEVRDSQLD